MRGMLDAADEADGLGDADGALRHFVGAMCRMHVADQGLKQMAASHFQGETRLVALRDELLSRLGRLVTEAKAAGVVRADVEPIDFIVLVNGVAASVLGLEEERAGLHERYLEIAFAGLRPHQDERPLPAGPPTPDELEAALQRQAELRGGECC
jgi:hypothetical protein